MAREDEAIEEFKRKIDGGPRPKATFIRNILKEVEGGDGVVVDWTSLSVGDKVVIVDTMGCEWAMRFVPGETLTVCSIDNSNIKYGVRVKGPLVEGGEIDWWAVGVEVTFRKVKQECQP